MLFADLISTPRYEDWHDIVRRAVIDAKAGDASARSGLSNYVINPKHAPSLFDLQIELLQNIGNDDIKLCEKLGRKLNGLSALVESMDAAPVDRTIFQARSDVTDINDYFVPDAEKPDTFANRYEDDSD